MQNEPIINKLSNDLMNDLEDIRKGFLDSKTANTICRHANTLMKSENIKLQYNRIGERIQRDKK